MPDNRFVINDSRDHPICVSLSSVVIVWLAFETAAAGVLCGLNFVVSIPLDARTLLIHRLIVLVSTGRCG